MQGGIRAQPEYLCQQTTQRRAQHRFLHLEGRIYKLVHQAYITSQLILFVVSFVSGLWKILSYSEEIFLSPYYFV